MPKELPSTIRGLRVPNTEYRYFDDHRIYPFRPDARGFDAVNAWWLAELSFLVYVKEAAFIQDRLAEAGFDGAVFIQRGGTYACLAHDRRSVILCFRGTDIRSLENLLTDVRIRRSAVGEGARVHRGFRDAIDLVWEPVAERAADLASSRALWVTGHSLGGALATLAASRLKGIAGLYTFGSPRVGDRAFCSAFPLTRCYRVVNDHDLVTHLPPRMGYRHVGEVRHLRRDGRILDGSKPWSRFRDNVTERLPGIVRNAPDLRALWASIVRENALSDHAPINYALRLWNFIERTERPAAP